MVYEKRNLKISLDYTCTLNTYEVKWDIIEFHGSIQIYYTLDSPFKWKYTYLENKNIPDAVSVSVKYRIIKTNYMYLYFSCDSCNHDLILTVLWDGVVHTSAQVRASAARLFEVGIQTYWQYYWM